MADCAFGLYCARTALEEIDAAQARLEAGHFGACEACGEAISLRRLRPTPTVRYCERCHATQNADR
jgi:DnaK suppressor protein